MDEPLKNKTENNAPRQGQAVLVQYDGVRCMAFQDAAGNWRNYFNGDVLPGKVQVLEESV